MWGREQIHHESNSLDTTSFWLPFRHPPLSWGYHLLMRALYHHALADWRYPSLFAFCTLDCDSYDVSQRIGRALSSTSSALPVGLFTHRLHAPRSLSAPSKRLRTGYTENLIGRHRLLRIRRGQRKESKFQVLPGSLRLGPKAYNGDDSSEKEGPTDRY